MLELRNLRHLAVLARRLNYARAAEELGISQPTLSRSIQALERQLDLRLFDRDRGGVELTPQGRLVAERAGLLVADAEDLERQSHRSAQGGAGRIRFGMAPMPARALLTGVLSERITEAPDVVHEVVVRDVAALWGLLLAGEIEFFVSQDGLLPDTSQARIDLLGHFPLCLIVRNGHPLLQGGGMGDGQMAERYPVVRSSWAGLPLPPEIAAHVRGAPQVIEDFSSLAGITAATDAIWFSSAFAASEALEAGWLRELPRPDGQPAPEVRVVMTSLARRSLSPLARPLRKAFRARVRAWHEARNEDAAGYPTPDGE
ncbi:LysR family transcriptional regulator [Sphingobium sufflavum]|uniref:LysR family transcriptional regulator n=1 Tax=Sphingobium sufflavum TaxID=1129547 RepID=UPI001F4475C0|nr:LysR family transcriptional regulator [Sphingobium sufflavum]MCE7796709.1 LysR family transcriptional regulator [Sphingobium sufflavum]